MVMDMIKRILVFILAIMTVSSPALAGERDTVDFVTQNGMLHGRSREDYPVADELLKGALVMYEKSTTAYVRNEKIKINADNPFEYPRKKDDIIYIPQRLAVDCFGITGEETVSIDGAEYVAMEEYAKAHNLYSYSNAEGLYILSENEIFKQDSVDSTTVNLVRPVTTADKITAWFRTEQNKIVEPVLRHEGRLFLQGEPSVISPGSKYPEAVIMPYYNGSVSYELLSPDGSVIESKSALALKDGEKLVLQPDGTATTKGNYELRLTFVFGGKELGQSLYFSCLNKRDFTMGKSIWAYLDNGKMKYTRDYLGNSIMDYSNVGYKGGGVALPNVPTAMRIGPSGEDDDTERLQAAIDEVSSLPMRADGYRGALVLEKGIYRVSSQISIKTSGVVLRGEGQGENDTVIIGTGTEKRNLIYLGAVIADKTFYATTNIKIPRTTSQITDLYVPIGAKSFNVSDASKYKPGDKVIVKRKGNAAWIHAIGMDTIAPRDPNDTSTAIQWRPFDFMFDRVITSVDGNNVTVNAPLPNSIEQVWGGGEIYRFADSERVRNVGIENLRVDSEYKTLEDESHVSYGVEFNHCEDAFMRNVTVVHAINGMQISRAARYVTVEDCDNFSPISIITGGRRYPYHVIGQLNFFQRNHSRDDRHGFVVSSRVMGPNVFLNGKMEDSHSTTEPHQRWSVGGLYDNVSADIAVQDRGYLGTGHGWAGANYVIWNCTGGLVLQKPPTSQNYSIGFVGKKTGSFFTRAQGSWESYGMNVKPQSLYLQQLEERLGKRAVENIKKPENIAFGEISRNYPTVSSIKINGVQIPNFSPDKYDYTIYAPVTAESMPLVTVDGDEYEVIMSRSYLDGIQVKVGGDSGVIYNITVKPSVSVAGETSASSEIAGHTAAMAFDNNTDTWWSGDASCFIEQSFSEPRRINEVKIKWHNGDIRSYKFRIETSLDGFSWLTVYEGTSSGKTFITERYRVSAQECQYVRIYVYGNDINDLSEIEEAEFV